MIEENEQKAKEKDEEESKRNRAIDLLK